ncbi:hypothetical protein GN244_ATG08872 [Phytophthora infestans]|uniref:Uncharacterized protein n=1 Tax=Phytophthora infestans TaxID=4787 RepID=A0A833TCX4_PHYIN|nr:hypothetical protein GN244_ATG08872 [Phytophthora infestans]KAF4143577.1 hypothetical protein GN958_ATG07310 [Phytophthora infestans]
MNKMYDSSATVLADTERGRAVASTVGHEPVTKPRARTPPTSVSKRRRTKWSTGDDQVQQRRQEQLEAHATRDARSSSNGGRRDGQDAAAGEATSAESNRGVHHAGDLRSTARNGGETQPGKGPQSVRGERQPEPSGDGEATQDAAVHLSSGGDEGGVNREAATAFAGGQTLRWRARPRRGAPPQAFMHSRVHGAVIKHGQRRKRNRAGRYVLEYQVAYRTVADSPVEKRWLGVDEFEAQLDATKEDQLGGDDE